MANPYYCSNANRFLSRCNHPPSPSPPLLAAPGRFAHRRKLPPS